MATTRKSATKAISDRVSPPLKRGYDVERVIRKFDKRLVRLAKIRRRKMPYDDITATFYGGELEKLTRTNYEKALANLWKAETAVPSFGIKDASREEKEYLKMKQVPELKETRQWAKIIESDEFNKKLDENYTKRQRQALARILSLILHGEAYAMFVSASLIPHVEGTGPKLGMAMQVMEEAKHFIVMREIVKKIDKIYPQNFGDFIALETILRAQPLDRLFGMNLVVESVAMTFFSTFTNFPGLDMILPLFHKDESRHSAFPKTYTNEVPLSFRQKYSPLRQQKRLWMLLPLLTLLPVLKEEGDKIGIDMFEFGGKLVDKVSRLCAHTGFYMPLPRTELMRQINLVLNGYVKATDNDHFTGFRDYSKHHSYRIRRDMQKVEDEIFGTEGFNEDSLVDRAMEKFYLRVAHLIDPEFDPESYYGDLRAASAAA